MIAEQMATWLIGSILFALGSMVLVFGLVLINNLLHKYWKPVTIVLFRNESIYPKIRYSIPEDKTAKEPEFEPEKIDKSQK